MSLDLDSENKTRRGRLILRIIVPVVITVFLISILLHYSNPQTIFQLVRNSAPSSLIAAFGIYVCVYLLRAIRFRQFPMLNQLSTSDLLPIASLHSFMNLIFPMRSGELSLVYLLRRFHQTEIGSGIGILLLVRLFDLIALALCLTGSLVLFGTRGDGAVDPWLLVIAILMGLIITLISLTASVWWRFLVEFLERVSEFLYLKEKSWCQTLLNWMDEIERVLQSAKRISFSIRLLATSLACWLSLFLAFWFLLQAVGISRFSYPEVIIGSTGAAITSAIPINAIGNLGTLQLGWTAGFSALGMSVEEGIASGFAINIFILIFSSALALISFLVLFRTPSGRSHERDQTM
jgi:uncharacterized protein (TIRG00374 family)